MKVCIDCRLLVTDSAPQTTSQFMKVHFFPTFSDVYKEKQKCVDLFQSKGSLFSRLTQHGIYVSVQYFSETGVSLNVSTLCYQTLNITFLVELVVKIAICFWCFDLPNPVALYSFQISYWSTFQKKTYFVKVCTLKDWETGFRLKFSLKCYMHESWYYYFNFEKQNDIWVLLIFHRSHNIVCVLHSTLHQIGFWGTEEDHFGILALTFRSFLTMLTHPHPYLHFQYKQLMLI